MPEEERKLVRVRTSSDRKKALDQYQEMKRMGRVESAVILCEMKDGTFQVLGQGMSIDQIASSLMVAARGVLGVKGEADMPKMEPHEEPVARGTTTQGKVREREITIDGEGLMVPPPGENIISCGECSHPRWYVLFYNANESPSRYACAHCGNEVKMIPVYHSEGTA